MRFLLQDLARREERVAGDDARRMRPVVEAKVPEHVAARVPAGERRAPREDEPAVHHARPGEARAPLAIDLVEVERVRVSTEEGHLHVLGLADGLADLVGDHVPLGEVLGEAGEPAHARGDDDPLAHFGRKPVRVGEGLVRGHER